MARLTRDTEGKEGVWDVDIYPRDNIGAIALSLPVNSPKSNEGGFYLQLTYDEARALIEDLQEMVN